MDGGREGRYDDARRVLASGLNRGLDRAVQFSRPAIIRHIEQSRRSRPDATPAEIVDVLGRRFTAAVATTGAAAGAAAAAPGVALPASLTLAVADATGFTGLAALYVFSMAEVYDIPVDELERRRTLLLGILLGDAGANQVRRVAERTGQHWARQVVNAIPVEALRRINRVLGRNFVTKYGTKQGVLVLGKQAPFGIGAAIGGAGNAAFAQVTIRSAKRAFGPPPAEWPTHLREMPSDDTEPATG